MKPRKPQSTATQHGGLETTALTFLPNLFHHGIIYVPLGYTCVSLILLLRVFFSDFAVRCLFRLASLTLNFRCSFSFGSHPDIGTARELHGASPYGAGTIAGQDGSRQPTDVEKGIAVHHGEYFAKIVSKSSK
jgi:NAD(P)H dehydrogenase (quinone)